MTEACPNDTKTTCADQTTPADTQMACGPGLPPNTPLIPDPLDYDEREEYTLARFLGLRLRVFSDTDESRPGTHPDPVPCPSWCWLAHQTAVSHEVNENTPFSAHHTLEHDPIVASSYYAGSTTKAMPGHPRRVHAATIEPTLEQWGSEAPRIPIGLRYTNRNGEAVYTPRRLVLSLEDSQDLILALQYLVDLGMNEREGHLPC